MKSRYFYLALALTALLACFLAIVSMYHSPTAGIKFAREHDNWYIADITGHSDAARIIKEHKKISTINDWKIEKYDLQKEYDDISSSDDFRHFMDAQEYLWKNIKPGIPFTITFSDGSSIQVTPSAMGLPEVLYRIGLLLLAGLITLLIGFSIFIKRPDDEKAIAFLLLTIGLSLTDTMVALAASRDIAVNYPIFSFLNILDSLSIFISVAALLHFILVFPHRQPFVNNTIIAIIYILALIEAVMFNNKILTPLVYPSMVIVNMAISMYFIVYNYITLKDPTEKAQIKWILFGIIFSLIVFILIYFLPMMITGEKLISAYIPMLSSLIMPLMMAFAIARYRLMDIDTILDNTLLYIITLGLLATGDLFIISTLTQLNIFSISEPVAIIIGIWLIIFVYIPVRDIIEKWLKKLLRREIYDIDQVSVELSRELLLTDTPQTAYKIVCDHIIDAIHPKGANAYIISEHGTIETIREDTKGLPIIVQIGQTEPVPISRVADLAMLPMQYSAGIFMPITGSNKKLLGYVTLENKHSGRLYDNNDLKLLKMASMQLAMAIESLRARTELHNREIEVVKEKERLSREIHDGVGNNLAQAKILIERGTEPAAILEELYPLLDEGLKEIRDLIWASDKENISITDFVSYIEVKLNYLQKMVPIVIETTLADRNLRLSTIQKMTILRVIQEGVTNAIKHSGADKITIKIEQDGCLKLSISDNGKGFDTSGGFSGYGIKNMQKRCEEIGAKFTIDSLPAKGTVIQFCIDLEEHT